jgi:hypothetical protein
MRVAAILLVAAGSAHADGLVLETGIGAPAGVTGGIGARLAHWQAVAEVGGAGAAFVGMLSGSLHVHRDVWWHPRDTLALGVSATYLGYIAGSDTVMEGTAETIAPTLQWRHAWNPRNELVVDAGPAIGHWRDDSGKGTFVMPMLAVRYAFAP